MKTTALALIVENRSLRTQLDMAVGDNLRMRKLEQALREVRDLVANLNVKRGTIIAVIDQALGEGQQ